MNTATRSTAVTIADRIAAAFEHDDVNLFADCFAIDAIQHHPFFPEPMRGREAVRAAEGNMFNSFGQIRFEVQSVVAEGDNMAVRFRVQAVHDRALPLPDGRVLAATGAHVDLEGSAFFRLDADGLIAEAWRYQDNLSFMSALGLLG